MTDKSNIPDPFAINEERASREREEAYATPSPNLSGAEIACTVGAFDEQPIPALFNPETRTVFPIRV